MVKMKIASKKCFYILLSFIFMAEVFAEDKLEEVVVTAQKRIQVKSEVPISIKVIEEDYIKKMGIKKIEDLIAYTENIHYTESGLSTQVRIRGIGSGNSQGFEQSVAQYMDGVYYGRAQLFRAPIYDVEQIEVLRGSQNAIFGKDSIAGAIVVTSAEPTEDLNGKLSLGYNPEFNQTEEIFNVSGALTDSLKARIAIRSLQEDGYMENTTSNQDNPGRKESAVRVKFEWTPTEVFSLKTKIEHSTYDVEGRSYEIVQDLPSRLTLDLIARQPGNETLKAIPSTYNNILTVLLAQPSFESNTDFKRQTALPEYSDNTINNVTIDGIYIFDNIEWHNKIARVGYSYDELCECDYVPANIFTLTLDEEYWQNSLDSFIKNNDSSNYQWLAGLYYQRSSLDFHDKFFVPSDSILKSLGNPLPGSGVDRAFNQDDRTQAIYGQFKFNLTEKTNLSINARYTVDEKTATRSLNIIDINDNPYQNSIVTCAYLSGLKVETVQSNGMPNDCASATPNLSKGVSRGNDQTGDHTEYSFTPSITLEHHVNKNNSIFLSVRSGHKSGGFDPRSNSAANFEFNHEESLSEELGFRTLSASGRFENGITFFHTDYDNLQVSQFDGGLGFNVGNADKTRSNGFEFDGRYLATDNFIVNYSAGYVDIKYKDFKNGNCYQGQIPTGIDSNSDGIADLCDYSGKRVGFTPSETFNIGSEYRQDLQKGNLIYTLNVEHISRHNVHENLDPRGFQDAYYMLNANITYQISSVTVSIIGNNLTNEYVKTYSSNVPLSGGSFGTNTLYAFSKRPRSYSLNVDYEF
jgi:iron complex outermembrane recepter protein